MPQHDEMETDEEDLTEAYDESVAAEDPDARRNLEPVVRRYLRNPTARQYTPFSTFELRAHPEADSLAQNFSLLLALQETPEIFEMVWRSTGPPEDVGHLNVLVERPGQRPSNDLGFRFIADRPVSETPMSEHPMNFRNWNVLTRNFDQIVSRIALSEHNVDFWAIFGGDGQLSMQDNSNALMLDPLSLNIERRRQLLLRLIPDFGRLGRLSYDEAGQELRNFMQQLLILQALLKNNLFAFISNNLDEGVLQNLQYTDNSQVFYREERDRVVPLLRQYHTRISGLPSQPPPPFDSELFSGHDWMNVGRRIEWIQGVGHVSDPAAPLRSFDPPEYQRFLGRVRTYQAMMDDDVEGLGEIAERFEHGVLRRFDLMREERANAYRARRGEYDVDTRGYVANLLPTVNRTFDQVSRGFPLGHAFIDGRPTALEHRSRAMMVSVLGEPIESILAGLPGEFQQGSQERALALEAMFEAVKAQLRANLTENAELGERSGGESSAPDREEDSSDSDDADSSDSDDADSPGAGRSAPSETTAGMSSFPGSS